jgi:spore maturation protein CgeB
MEKDFEIGEDLVVWEDIDDLIAKINYYLQNDTERSRIATKGCAKVRSNFTWHNFAQNLKQIIKKYE